MSTTPNLLRQRVSTAALALALIICAGLWLASAGVYYATSGFSGEWSATPLWWLLTALVTPAMCFAGGLMLVAARKPAQFSRLEWCGLAAIFLPVTVGTGLALWAVKGLLVMSGL
jgi:hypothetical protein